MEENEVRKPAILSPNFQSTPMSKKSFQDKIDESSRFLPYQKSSSYGQIHTDRTLSNSGGKQSYHQSPSSWSIGTHTSLRKSLSPSGKLSDVDSSTVIRQRHELQMMIAELKDRDRELNELVSSHHQQLVAWEVDRQRLQSVDKQMAKSKVELKKRHNYCKVFKERIRLIEGELTNKTRELETTQKQLQHMKENTNKTESQMEEYQAKNTSMKETIEELSKSLAESQSKQQEIGTILRLKDKDIEDANIRIGELTDKLQCSNKDIKKHKQMESQSKLQLEKLTVEKTTLKAELEKLEEAVMKQNSTNDESMEEFNNMKQEMLVLQKELLLAGEREKRKDSLLELSKSKQDRTELELKQLRKLSESLQHEHLSLKQNMYRQDDELSMITLSDALLDEKCMDVFDKMNLMESATSNLIKSQEKLTRKEEGGDASSKKYGNEVIANKTSVSSLKNPVDITQTTFTTEDIGEMTTAELKEAEEIPTYVLLGNYDDDDNEEEEEEHEIRTNFLDESLSPTSRLNKLLSESRRMVKTLETSPTILSSIRSSPIQNLENSDNEEF